MIVDIRGTNGSGKTTTAKRLMELGQGHGYTLGAIRGADGKVQDYSLVGPQVITFLGRYETPTGGCDTIPTQDDVVHRVIHYQQFGHVVFEGAVVSTIFERYRALAARWPRGYIWAFLDTPFDVCVERVLGRRAARGNVKPLDLSKSLTPKWGLMRTLYQKCQAHHLDARWVPYQSAPETVWGWLHV